MAIGLVLPSIATAASCCGGGISTPSLITGDDKAQISTTLTHSKVDTDVFSNGVWQKRTSDDLTDTLKIEGAHIFNDRFQAGFSVPVQSRTKAGDQGGKSSGFGDLSAQMGYEYLPDWDYNPWRPHGVGFLSLVVPTGKSIYEAQESGGLDSHGRGFYSLGIGTALTKTWSKLDGNFTFEVHRSFEKTVHDSQLDGTIKPGYGHSISIGSGYNLKNLRIGGTLAWSEEDPIDVQGSNSSAGSKQRYATGTLATSYLFEDNWSGSILYTDQTIFGNPSNSSLSKSIAVTLQKRWLR